MADLMLNMPWTISLSPQHHESLHLHFLQAHAPAPADDTLLCVPQVSQKVDVNKSTLIIAVNDKLCHSVSRLHKKNECLFPAGVDMSVTRPLCSCHCFFFVCAEKKDVSLFAPSTQSGRQPPMLPLKDTYCSQQDFRMLISQNDSHDGIHNTDIPGANVQLHTNRTSLPTCR